MSILSEPVVVIISADAEWEVARSTLRTRFSAVPADATPYGEVYEAQLDDGFGLPLIFTHGGWGKIDAAASAQYAIDRWAPRLLVNLGTCGGFEGAIDRDAIVLADRTVVYDIVEQMSDPEAAFAHYTATLDLSWLREPYPHPVHRGLMLSGDRDLVVEDVPFLREHFGGTVGDWESGSIAHVATKNGVRCLVLRGVTDLLGAGGSDAYDGTLVIFRERAECVMSRLLASLPDWLARVAW